MGSALFDPEAALTKLVRYEEARRALAAAHRVDEVKDIRDKAEAMAAYARQARDTELIQYATEIKVRAERRCGELLVRSERAKPGDNQHTRSSNDATTCKPTLADMGLSKNESSRYQQLAAMPEEHFETAIKTARANVGEVTTAHMLRVAEELRRTVEAKEGLLRANEELARSIRHKAIWNMAAAKLELVANFLEEPGVPPPVTPQTAERIRDAIARITTYLERTTPLRHQH
jgi:hypothetical protein